MLLDQIGVARKIVNTIVYKMVIQKEKITVFMPGRKSVVLLCDLYRIFP